MQGLGAAWQSELMIICLSLAIALERTFSRSGIAWVPDSNANSVGTCSSYR
jgi:hypothetical protein